MYNLDFETIQQVMREHQKTGILSAQVPAGAGLAEPGRVEVRLQAGTVVSCVIIGSDGRKFTEKETLKRLARIGRLKWTFVPQEEALATPDPLLSPMQALSPMPRQLVILDQVHMQSWPRLHRMVFALADGTRSVQKIAEMLSLTQEQVEGILRDLQSIKAITMGLPGGRESF